MPNPNLLKLAVLNGQPEIFHSIQGEGKSVGRPSVFVRTSLCNLHCIWCDTDYTWNWKGTPFTHVRDRMPGYEKFDKRTWLGEYAVADIAERIQRWRCKNIVLTGGEPMMQQDALAHLMEVLQERAAGAWFETETNGTLLFSERFDRVIHQYNVSPKLSNSNNTQRQREKPRVLHAFAQNEKANFKFVLTDPADLSEILYLMDRYGIPPHRVWLMPEGNTAEQLAQRRVWLTEVCKTYQFHYSDRLHVQIWGDKKGV